MFSVVLHPYHSFKNCIPFSSGLAFTAWKYWVGCFFNYFL